MDQSGMVTLMLQGERGARLALAIAMVASDAQGCGLYHNSRDVEFRASSYPWGTTDPQADEWRVSDNYDGDLCTLMWNGTDWDRWYINSVFERLMNDQEEEAV